ncbi:unnamed protein product, partial [Prorocentrum cordatum]
MPDPKPGGQAEAAGLRVPRPGRPGAARGRPGRAGAARGSRAGGLRRRPHGRGRAAGRGAVRAGLALRLRRAAASPFAFDAKEVIEPTEAVLWEAGLLAGPPEQRPFAVAVHIRRPEVRPGIRTSTHLREAAPQTAWRGAEELLARAGPRAPGAGAPCALLLAADSAAAAGVLRPLAEARRCRLVTSRYGDPARSWSPEHGEQ